MKHATHLASVATAALIAGTTSGLAQAQTQEFFDLGELVVSASLTPTDPARTGATVETLDAGELARDTTLAQSLARTPGVTFTANGGLGANSTLRIRGLDTRYIGTRLDGIDITDPSSTQTAFNFGGLTGDNFGRVEVLKGSQSALYGSEAIGGVVDLRTLTETDLGFGTRLSAEAGSFGTYRGSVGITNTTETGAIALTLSRVTSDGISARAGDDEKDAFSQTLLTISGRQDVSDTVTLGFSGFLRQADVEIDRSTTDNSGENETDQRGARVFAEIDAFGIDHTFSASTYSNERRDPGGFVTRFDGNRDTLAYRGVADLAESTTLMFGLEHTTESFDTSTDEGEVDTTSALAEVIYRPTDTLDLSFALRHDDHSEFGGKTTGRAALAWQAQPDLTVRASLGTGFRAPSLFERFSLYGSETLEPESSRSFDLGVEKTYGSGAFVKATLFYTEIDDLIDFDPASTACASGFGCYAQVEGTTVTKGLELSGGMPVSDRIAIYGSYTLTDAETEGTRLTNVPRHDLVLGVDAEFTDRFTGGFEVQHVADVEPSAFAPADHKVGDYTLANMTLSYDIADGAEAYLRVENLFDEDYETAGGFNTPGRAVFVGLRADF